MRSAPWSYSTCAMGHQFSWAVIWTGVKPILLLKLASDPLWSRRTTISRWPSWQARWRAVKPDYKQIRHVLHLLSQKSEQRWGRDRRSRDGARQTRQGLGREGGATGAPGQLVVNNDLKYRASGYNAHKYESSINWLVKHSFGSFWKYHTHFYTYLILPLIQHSALHHVQVKYLPLPIHFVSLQYAVLCIHSEIYFLSSMNYTI